MIVAARLCQLAAMFAFAGFAALAVVPAAEAAKPRPESELEIPFEVPVAARDEAGRRVDDASGLPLALYRVGYRPQPAAPEEMAREYLRHAAATLGLDPDLSDLEPTMIRTGPSGTVVRFRQHVDGIPVYGPDLAVKLDRGGLVTHVVSGYRPSLTLAANEPAVSAPEARAIAFDYLRIEGGAAWERTGLVVFPGADGARLTYQVDVIAGRAPAGEWRIMVDAVTAVVFGAEDRAVYGAVDGSATVFDPDPLSSAGATYGDPGYVDGSDADTAQLTAEVFTRTLRDITESAGTFSLVGPWAECVDWAAPFKGCFAQASSDWNFTREPDAFEAANTYYAIDTYMRYLNETLGLAIEPHQYPGGVQYDPHGFNGADNSSYSPGTGRLQFGEGGVDDAEDADVIVHELGHGLHDWVTGGSLSQVQGLSEGVGDFAAAEYSRSFGHWDPADPQFQWVFSWDGHNPFWGGRVTNWTDTHVYPDDLTGQIHTDGQFWSSCNMQVWDAIGRDATVIAHWEGLAMTNGATNQLGAAEAVVQAATDLDYDPADIAQIVSLYQGCGYAVSAAPLLTFDPATLDFGEVEVGTTSPPQIATLHNDGSALATGLAFAGLPDDGFAADTGDCGASLAPGASCEVSVTFTPAEPGAATATLEASSAEGSAASLAVEGEGVPAAVVATPMELEVDPDPGTADGNGVFEPAELVTVAPAWRNDGASATELTGGAAGFGGPAGAVYSLVNSTAAYGLVAPGATASCLDTGDCYQMGLNDPATRPAAHWDATFEETLAGGPTRTWTLHVGDSFSDVPRTSLFYSWVETLLHHGVTGGCGATEYCPSAANTRDQMPVFLLKALEGPGYAPPACTGVFDDVPCPSLFANWIEDLVARGVTAGCGGGNYCPNNPVTRDQMAVFLLKTLEGPGYAPPACTGVFGDVPCPSLFAAWIEDLVARGITAGCGGGNYCPSNPVSRDQMAVFLSKTFSLTLYGP
ncbi:MAG: choice-of-anchor D domain-containing protein [Thermoanaerobaculia bacterium]